MADSPNTRREVETDPRVDRESFDNKRYQTTGDPEYLHGSARDARDERVR